MSTLYEIPMPLVALTGEPASGKSLFPILSTPNATDLTKPSQAIGLDQEDSLGPYVGALNFSRCDIRQMIADGFHRHTRKADTSDAQWKKVLLEKADVSASSSASIFRASVLAVLEIDPGEMLVCSFDTFKPLQEGATDWLLLHPEAFGRTLAQYQKMKAAILIPDARRMLDHILLVECRARFEMTVLTFHQKNEWEGIGENARKTGQRVSEAWEIADRLCTLYVTLDRRPKAKGKQAPRVPSAITVWPYGKSRLLKVHDGNLVPVLPPRMPEFTPEALRAYMANPPNYANLSADERMPDDSMTDDQKLQVQARMATDNRVAEESKAAAEQSKLSALELARQAMQGTHAAQPQTQSQPTPQQPNPDSITAQQRTEMLAVMKQLFPRGAEASRWLQVHYEVADLAAMSKTTAENALIELTALLAEKKATEIQTPAPAPQTAEADGPATAEQRNRIRELTTQVFGDKAADAQAHFLQSLGLNAAASLTQLQANRRITELEAKAATKAERPDDDIPF